MNADINSTSHFSAANNTLELHEVIQNHENSTNIVTVIELAIKIWEIDTKPLNCPNGYIRANFLTVENKLNAQTITYESSYFDSGFMFKTPPSTIAAGQKAQYETVNTAATETGANVMFNFGISGSPATLTVLIENPWSGGPLIGVCYGKFPTTNKYNY